MQHLPLSSKQLQQEIVASYDPDDPDFGQKALDKVWKYYDDLPASTSKTDSMRLASRATTISRLRMALLDSAGSLELNTPESKEFDALSPHEQLKFQKRAQKAGTPRWILKAAVMPENLLALKMPRDKAQQLMDQQIDALAKATQKDMPVFDCDELLKYLCGPMLSETSDWRQLTAGLLLATGRRTSEILKTADFYLAEGMTMDGNRCMFTGQLKSLDSDAYAIPLLCSFSLVRSSLDRLRKLVDTKDVDTQSINSKYRKPLANLLARFKITNPHMLRAIYAKAVYKLTESKMSMTGFISKVLGQKSPSTAAHYDTLEVKITDTFLHETPVDEIPTGFIALTKPQKKRLLTIKLLMARRVPISASAMRREDGGSMGVAAAVIDLNRDLIVKYNEGIAKERDDARK